MSSRSRRIAGFATAGILLAAIACVESDETASPPIGEVENEVALAQTAPAEEQASETAAAVPEAEEAADDQPEAAVAVPAAPKPKYPGFDFTLSEGAFGEYQWETKSSYFAARGWRLHTFHISHTPVSNGLRGHNLFEQYRTEVCPTCSWSGTGGASHDRCSSRATWDRARSCLLASTHLQEISHWPGHRRTSSCR